MAVREIIVDGDERLRKKSRIVENISDEKIQTLIDDMVDTLHATSNGIGLSAVQVGMLKRIFIIDMQDERGVRTYINPEIILKEGKQCHDEGCLSLPDFWGLVERPARVIVRAFDRYGNQFEEEATELDAICICHENDHLDGILFKDKIVQKEIEA